MVIRWRKTARLQPGESVPSYSPEGVIVTTLEHDPHWRWKMGINALGALVTAVVVIIFAVAKFTEGAWVTVLLVPSLVFVFFRIHHHYKSVRSQLALGEVDIDGYLDSPPRRIRVLAIGSLDRHSLPALRDMLQTGGRGISQLAVHVDTGDIASEALRRQWEQHGFDEMGIALVSLPSEFGGGNIVGDLVDYVHGMLAADPEIRVELVIPEWTAPSTWWQWPFIRGLHHATGTRLKLAFLDDDRVSVTNHRYVLGGEAARTA